MEENKPGHEGLFILVNLLVDESTLRTSAVVGGSERTEAPGRGGGDVGWSCFSLWIYGLFSSGQEEDIKFTTLYFLLLLFLMMLNDMNRFHFLPFCSILAPSNTNGGSDQ